MEGKEKGKGKGKWKGKGKRKGRKRSFWSFYFCHILSPGISCPTSVGRRSVVREGALCIAGIHHHFTDCAHPGPPSPSPSCCKSYNRQCENNPERNILFLLVQRLLAIRPTKEIFFTVIEVLSFNVSILCRYFILWDAKTFLIAVWLKPTHSFHSSPLLSSHRLRTCSIELNGGISSCWSITFSVVFPSITESIFSFALKAIICRSKHLSPNHRNERLKGLLAYLVHASTNFLYAVQF